MEKGSNYILIIVEKNMLNYDDIFDEIKKLTNYYEFVKRDGSIYDEIGINSEDIENIYANKTVSYYRIIHNNGMIFFIKRVIRKLIKFVVEPITNDISNYNNSNTNIIMQLLENNKTLLEQYNILKKENDALKERIVEIEKKLDNRM